MAMALKPGDFASIRIAYLKSLIIGLDAYLVW
jgi:hypothetical protein